MTAFASIADLETRYPAELIKLAADEATGVRDDGRIQAALEDASIEVRTILKARYAADELARLDAESLQTLKLYTMDITLYRVAIAFSRSTERLEEMYKTAVKRLEAIAMGRGALSFTGDSGATEGEPSDIGQGETVIDVPERLFTRSSQSGL